MKSPKVYLRDSGVLHALLQIDNLSQLQAHPSLGAAWEGFAIEQVIDLLQTRDAYFWATHGGAELDLLVLHRGKRYGFEFEYRDAPRRTRSMRIACEDLGLEKLWVIYPGSKRYTLDEQTEVIPLTEIPDLSARLLRRDGGAGQG